MSGRPTYLWAAEVELRRHRRPLTAAEIVTYAQRDGLFSARMFSATPQKSLQARISLEILNNGERSKFVRTGPGRFYLRSEPIEPQSSPRQRELFPSTEIAHYEWKKRTPASPKENVLVVPRSHFQRFLNFQGFRKDDGALLRKLLAGPITHLPRTAAEETEEYKQVVTYVIVTHGKKVLSFKRGMFSRAAAFLHGSSCIGFGGHVTQDDWNLFSRSDSGIADNALRELQEEIAIEKPLHQSERARIRVEGIINDDSSDVGRRHFAVVMRYEVRNWRHWREPSRGEAAVNQLHWIDLSKDIVNLMEYEYWSQICLREFFPRILRAQASFQVIRKKPFQGKPVIVVAGGIGSGKSFVTKYLVKKFGYVEVNTGKILAALMNVPPVPKTSRSIFQQLAWQYVSTSDGQKKFGGAILEEVKRLKTGAVIDGLRLRTTLAEIRSSADVPVAMLFVSAPPDLAYELYAAREHPGGKKPKVEQFLALVGAETEREIPGLIAEADAVLYNWSGERELSEALNEMADSLKLKRLRAVASRD